MEDVYKYKQFVIATDEDYRDKYTNKYNQTQAHYLYSENCIGIPLDTKKVNLNKPIGIGFTILEMSKQVMYDTHYNVILKRYPNAKLVSVETDSFVYDIELPEGKTEYDFWYSIRDIMDFHTFPKSSEVYKKLHKEKNDNKDGLFKNDIYKGKPNEEEMQIKEYIALRPKCSSYVCSNGDGSIKMKAIKKYAQNQMDHQDYLLSYNEETNVANMSQEKFDKFIDNFKGSYNTIKATHKEIYTEKVTDRMFFNSADDKSYWVNNSERYSFGHKNIR
jgi:hypothetical protein